MIYLTITVLTLSYDNPQTNLIDMMIISYFVNQVTEDDEEVEDTLKQQYIVDDGI